MTVKPNYKVGDILWTTKFSPYPPNSGIAIFEILKIDLDSDVYWVSEWMELPHKRIDCYDIQYIDEHFDIIPDDFLQMILLFYG